MNAGELVAQSLGLILVRSADVPLEPDEQQDAFTQLNNMMAAWNLALGYTAVSNPSDDITVIDGALDAMVQNLALKLSPQYGVAVSPDLRINAKNAKNDLLKIAITISRSKYPSTLPRGTGNNRYNGRIFYPASDAELGTEEGGAIELE